MKRLSSFLILIVLVCGFCQPARGESYRITDANVGQGAFPYKGRLISIEIDSADLDVVLRMFSEIMDINIVAHPDVHGKVTNLRLIDVPVDQAFQMVLRLHGLYADEEQNVTIIYPVQLYIQDARERIRLHDLF